MKKLLLLPAFIITSFIGLSQDKLNVNIQISDLKSYENGNGTLTAEVTGGVEPYYILWSNGSTNKKIENVGEKNYLIRVSDSKGNTIEELVILKSNKNTITK